MTNGLSVHAASKCFAWSDRAQDKEWLDLLWEVGRSVTIQVRLCPSETDWALARNHASECLKSIKDAALSATFIDFARIVRQLNIQQVSDGTHHKLRFKQCPIQCFHAPSSDGHPFLESMMALNLKRPWVNLSWLMVAICCRMRTRSSIVCNRFQKELPQLPKRRPMALHKILVKLQVGWWEWFTLLCVWAWPIQARQQKFGFWATGSMGPTGIGRHASLLWRWGGQNM